MTGVRVAVIAEDGELLELLRVTLAPGTRTGEVPERVVLSNGVRAAVEASRHLCVEEEE